MERFGTDAEDGVLQGDYPGAEFYVGGRLFREVLSEDTQKKLKDRGVHLYRLASQALDAVAQQTTGRGFLSPAGKDVG